MNKVWIFLLVVHGCVSEHVATRAYKTEVECNQALNKEKLQSDGFIEVHAQCESVEALLEETKNKHD